MAWQATGAIAIIGLLAGLAAPAVADQLTSTTLVQSDHADSSMLAGMKTSDWGAAFQACHVDANGITTCVEQEPQASYPKNMGNALCVESTVKVTIDAVCNTLFAQPNGGCQQNSALGSCAPRSAYGPYCNYRTSSNGTVSANWQWFVTQNSDGSLSIGCNAAGYVGTTSTSGD